MASIYFLAKTADRTQPPPTGDTRGSMDARANELPPTPARGTLV